MRLRNRFPRVNFDNIHCWGRDDITGLPVMMNETVKQMEYIGGRLAWRGFMTHYSDVDQPNPQLIPPKMKPDPVSIRNPRIMQLPELPAIPSGLTAIAATDTTITVSWDAVSSVTNYVVGWKNYSWNVYGEDNSIPTTYTINSLSPGSTYLISVATYLEGSGTSSFSDAIAVNTL